MDAFTSTPMVSHVGKMVLQYSKRLTVYTNGDEAVSTSIQTESGLTDFETRVTIEKRRIKSLKLISRYTSDVLVTLEDGTEIKEKFIVRLFPSPLKPRVTGRPSLTDISPLVVGSSTSY